MPRKSRKWVKPNIPNSPPVDRKFVDLNGNEVKVRKIYNLETELNGIKREVLWWEVDAKTKPIKGMDSFELLSLELKQNCETNETKKRNQKDETKETKKCENSSNKETSTKKIRREKVDLVKDDDHGSETRR